MLKRIKQVWSDYFNPLHYVKTFGRRLYRAWFKVPVSNKILVKRSDFTMWWSGLFTVAAFSQLVFALWFPWATIIGAFVFFMLAFLNEMLSILYRNLAVSNYVMGVVDPYEEEEPEAEPKPDTNADEHEGASV